MNELIYLDSIVADTWLIIRKKVGRLRFMISFQFPDSYHRNIIVAGLVYIKDHLLTAWKIFGKENFLVRIIFEFFSLRCKGKCKARVFFYYCLYQTKAGVTVGLAPGIVFNFLIELSLLIAGRWLIQSDKNLLSLVCIWTYRNLHGIDYGRPRQLKISRNLILTCHA